MKGTLRILALSGLLAIVMLIGGATPFAAAGAPRPRPVFLRTNGYHAHLDCAGGSPLCTESDEPVGYNGAYTGHDEPSLLFYSNQPGSGNSSLYRLILPKDPPTAPAQDGSGGTPNFMLHPAFWFGMAMCDSQSAPNPGMNCPADTDANIANNSNPAAADFIGNHPGGAYMEMQFYPPGWAPWPAGDSCDKTKWCAALNIDSLSLNENTGQALNPTCASLTGVEYVNFAFITKSGTPQPGSPPNPVNATLQTYTPDPSADLFMNSGDTIIVRMHDTPNGFKVVIVDQTTGQTGSMTASAANDFGQIQFDPTGTTCNNIPYDFHPMYGSSSENTRLTWTAHSYNIAFSDEIGHFQYCSAVDNTGACTGTETNNLPADADDVGCFTPDSSFKYQIMGCLGTNTGFDGPAYDMKWPGTNPKPAQDHKYNSTSVLFSSPKFRFKGATTFTGNYSRIGFETDLPRIEDPGFSPSNNCNRQAGTGCTNPPLNDSGGPATFYPFFSTGMSTGSCMWQLGGPHMPGTVNLFGGSSTTEFGSLLPLLYIKSTGLTETKWEDFRQVINNNPCKAP